jgi:glycosyltransferase involved in cell wall biosynthesis
VPRYALLLAPYRLLYGIPTAMWYSHNTADLRLRLALPFVDRVLTVSHDSFPLPSDKCRVVGHGVDTELFRPGNGEPRRHEGTKGPQFPAPDPQPPTRFLSLGRVSPRKDQNLMVSAADVLVNRWGIYNAEFVIAGGPLVPEDREYFQRLRDRVTDRALERHFTFTGSVPHSHTARPLQACDFFVNMHVEGGLGKAVLEAMSCAKPALVSTPTYYQAFPEYAGNFLFAPRDAEDLAWKMKSCIEMPAEERRAAGTRLREWVVREHDVRRQMSRVAQLMREMTGGYRPSSE